MITDSGTPYDRGGADSFYRRSRQPHYYKGGLLAGCYVPASEMTDQELADYERGFQDNEDDQNFKDWE